MKGSSFWGFMLAGSVGALLMFISATAALDRAGYWATDIDTGTYVVTSVQVIKEDVYLTIEYSTGTSNTESERLELRPYNLPLGAFTHPFKKDGKQLIVTKERGYKYLRLE